MIIKLLKYKANMKAAVSKLMMKMICNHSKADINQPRKLAKAALDRSAILLTLKMIRVGQLLKSKKTNSSIKLNLNFYNK